MRSAARDYAGDGEVAAGVAGQPRPMSDQRLLNSATTEFGERRIAEEGGGAIVEIHRPSAGGSPIRTRDEAIEFTAGFDEHFGCILSDGLNLGESLEDEPTPDVCFLPIHLADFDIPRGDLLVKPPHHDI